MTSRTYIDKIMRHLCNQQQDLGRYSENIFENI